MTRHGQQVKFPLLLSEQVLSQLKGRARADKRSLSNYLRVVLQQHLESNPPEA